MARTGPTSLAATRRSPALLAVAWHVGWLVVVMAAVGGLAAFGLPLLAARMSWRAGGRIAGAFAGLRVACLDTLTGLREVRAFGAEAGPWRVMVTSSPASTRSRSEPAGLLHQVRVGVGT